MAFLKFRITPREKSSQFLAKNWGNWRNFFLEKLFRILKRLFDVKRPSDSKYSRLMNVARREVHEILVFKHQKLVFSWFEGEGQKNFGTFWNLFSKSILKDFWRIKTRNSWTSRRATFMRREYLESEGLFTSNGFFKIWNNFSRKKFIQFPQFLAKSSFQR